MVNNVLAEVHSFALPQPEPEEEAPSHHDPPDLGSSCHDDDEAFGGMAGAAVRGTGGLELEHGLGAFGGVAGAAMRCGCGSTPRAATAGGIGFAAAGAAIAASSSCDATVPRGRTMPGGGGVGGCRGTPAATDMFFAASSVCSPAKCSKASANTRQAFAFFSIWSASELAAIASSEHKAELTTSTAFPTASRNSLFRFSSTVEA